VTNQKIKSVQRAVNAGIVAVDCDVEFSVIDLKTGSAVLVPKEIKSLLSDRLAAQQALLAGKFS
jgi:acyl-CoA thioesterase FadM